MTKPYQMCGVCCDQHKQSTGYASRTGAKCDECGAETSCYIFTDNVIASQERDNDISDMWAERAAVLQRAGLL